MTERTRPAPGAELFVAESVVEAIADLGDGAYDSESPVSGFILGTRNTDRIGSWCEALALSYDEDDEDIVGWFRTSESDGLSMSDSDLKRHASLFGKTRSYAVMVDPSQSSFSIYTVEDGVPVKVRALMSEGN